MGVASRKGRGLVLEGVVCGDVAVGRGGEWVKGRGLMGVDLKGREWGLGSVVVRGSSLRTAERGLKSGRAGGGGAGFGFRKRSCKGRVGAGTERVKRSGRGFIGVVNQSAAALGRREETRMRRRRAVGGASAAIKAAAAPPAAIRR